MDEMPEHRIIWRNSVAAAVNRIVQRTGRRTFSRDELIRHEMDRIIEETQSNGRTPRQTLSRVLQELRDDGEIEFLVCRGEYRAIREEVR